MIGIIPIAMLVLMIVFWVFMRLDDSYNSAWNVPTIILGIFVVVFLACTLMNNACQVDNRNKIIMEKQAIVTTLHSPIKDASDEIYNCKIRILKLEADTRTNYEAGWLYSFYTMKQ